MKNLDQVFKLKRRLKYKPESMGLSYKCEVDLFDYEAAETRVETAGTYSYPEMIHVKIESWNNYFYSFRLSDGKWIAEGRELSGVGITTAQLYRRILKNLKAHAKSISKSEMGKEAV